jgi:branched-chain amino acid transport system permease protein
MLDVLVYGAVSSVIYALLALGFSLVFGVARVLNLCHGSFFAIAAYTVYVATTVIGLPLWLGCLCGIVVAVAFAWVLEVVLVRPLRTNSLAVLMITLAVALLVEQVFLLVFGSQSVNVPAFFDGAATVFGVNISGQRLLMVGIGAVAIAAVWSFIHFTRFGAAILAVSQDPVAAQYVGIPADRMFAVVFAIAGGLAGLAAVLAAPFLSVAPDMYLLPMIKAFAIVIVGGMGSLGGSILAAFLLGYTETAVAFFYSSSLSELVSLVAVFLVLAFRPAGLLGKRVAF